jgi:hypothetical protein
LSTVTHPGDIVLHLLSEVRVGVFSSPQDVSDFDQEIIAALIVDLIGGH